MNIEFYCPVCNQHVSTGSHYSGKPGKCPGCGNVIQIPPLVIVPSRPGPKRASVLRYCLAPVVGLILLGTVAIISAIVLQSGKTPTMVRNSRTQESVRRFLHQTERKVKIVAMHGDEPIRGCTYWPGRKWGIGWLSFEGDRYVALAVVDGFRDGELGLAEAGDPWRIENNCDLAELRAVRVEYTTDEGFSRTAKEDRVFLVTDKMKVAGSIPTDAFRIGKPGTPRRTAGETAAEKFSEFLDSAGSP